MRSRAVPLLLAFLLVAAGSASARTLKVPRDYPTIQTAVDEARYGDLVLVKKGTYEEDVKIVTAGVRLLGEGKPVIDAKNLPLFIEGATSVIVTGFRLLGSRGDGVLIRQCSTVTIEKCVIRDTVRSGVRVEGSANVVIRSCKFADIGDAGVVLTTDSLGIGTSDCTIYRNEFKSADDDAIVVQGDRNTIEKNTIGPVRGIGIHLFGGADNVVTKNVVKDVGDIGILVRSIRTTLLKNKVSRAGSDGIQVDTSGNILEKNKANRSSGDGLELNAGGNDVIRNRAGKSGDYDLAVNITTDTNHYEKNKFKKVAP